MSQEIQYIKIDDLHLWTENPRDPIDSNASDIEIMKKAIEDKKVTWKLGELLNKMGSYYDFSELPTVVKQDKKYIVYDGNRRIALLKYLQNKKIYHTFGGGLFFQEEEAKELIELTKIPCNVCDIDTALNNVERKHSKSGSWSILDREYFLHLHKGAKKSIFLMLEEATGLIGTHEKLNQRFVKEEVLTKENLESIGLAIKDDNLFSMYTDDFTKSILDKLVESIDAGKIKTRTDKEKGTIRVSKGELKKALESLEPSLQGKINPYDSKKMTK